MAGEAPEMVQREPFTNDWQNVIFSSGEYPDADFMLEVARRAFALPEFHQFKLKQVEMESYHFYSILRAICNEWAQFPDFNFNFK